MEILIENSRVMVDQNVDHVKNVSYAYTPWKDNVTLFINNSYKMAPIRDVVVNGIQMTADNIDELLIDLFKDESCRESGSNVQSDWLEDNASDASFIQNRPHSQQSYAEVLVLPKAVCTGHTLDIIKDGSLYQTYQWNGWLWELIGMEPNFIFKEIEGVRSQNLDDYFFYKKDNEKCYISSLYGGSGGTISASSILKSEYLIHIQNFYLVLDNDAVVENIHTSNLFDISYSDQKEYQVKNIYLKNIHTNIDFFIRTPQSSLVVEDSDIGYNSMASYPSIKCNSICISRSEVFISIGLYPKIVDSEITDISINDCNIEYGNFYITLNPEKKADGSYRVIKRANIVYKGNGNAQLYISGLEKTPTIENVDLDASKLTEALFNNLAFSDSAFANLIDALTSVTVNSVPLTYKDCTPAFTDAQKTQIAAAGWELQ